MILYIPRNIQHMLGLNALCTHGLCQSKATMCCNIVHTRGNTVRPPRPVRALHKTQVGPPPNSRELPFFAFLLASYLLPDNI